MSAGLRMGEYKSRGVEEVAIERDGRWRMSDVVRRSIEAVANDRVSEGLKMDANLVGATGLDANFDQGEVAVERRVNALENLYVGDGRPYAFTVRGAAGGHASAPDEIAADGKPDGDVVFGKATVDESDVGLFKLAPGKHLAELAVGAIVFRDDDDAAGLLVEAMDDARSQIAADM